MRAIIYKGLEIKPSEEIKLKEGKLAPQLKHLGDHIAISGGQKCGKKYCVKKNDIITVRVYAGAPVLIVVTILAIPFVVVGIVKLVNLYQDLKKLSQRKTINRKVESLPYLGGAENQLATGQTQPVIIGEHLFTPYFIDYPLSRISGTDGRDQFTYRVYELGFKEQVIKEIKAGKASLKKFSLSEPQEGKFNLDATSSLYDADAFFEITQGGEFLTEEFNKKYYHLESGAILPKKKDGVQGELNFELPANSKYIEVAILFNGLIGYSDDGSKTSRSVEIKPQYSLDGSTWTTFAFDGATNNVFTRITQEQIRFTGRKTFTYAEIKDQTEIIKVRLLCPTVASTQQGYDDCYCVYVQAELFNVEDSKKQDNFVAEKRLPDKQRGLSTRLGLKIKATEDNQDKLGQINVITQGVAPTPAGNWISKTPTSNPASWLYEILTSETHPLSAISKDEIDLASFTELFYYCEDEGLEVNAVLLEARPKQQVLEMVLRLCNSVLYRNMTGQLQVATDKLNSQPIALFTSQNVLSTTIDKNLERKTDGVLINYIDSSLGYEQASHLVMHQGEEETPDSVISTVQAEGITNYEQVVKFGRRLLANETLRPKTVKVQTSLEGVFYTPMSKVLLQTETLKTGKGNGEIKKVILDDNDLITHLELYENFEFTDNETNIIVVSMTRFAGNFTHTVANFEVASSEGKTIELATPISAGQVNAPQKGDTLAYGVATEPVISEMIIAGVAENANGYTLTLVDYNEAMYDIGEIPEYKPSWASEIGDKPPATLPPLTLDDLQTYVELEAPDTPTITAIAQKNSLRLSASVQDGAKNGIAKIEWSLKKDGNYELIGTSNSAEFVYALDDYYEAEDFATWRVKAKVFNANGKGTESLPVTINTDTYGTWILNSPTVTNSTSKRSVILQLSTASGSREQYSTIQYRVQVQKQGEENWYKPDLVSDPYASENNYKDGEGYVTVANTFIQSVPMEDQEAGIKTTAYNYRIVGVSVETQAESEPTIITATATASTAMDIYDASIGVEKLAVNDLSAISGTFGDIKSDAIEKDATNFWILSKTDSNLGYGRAGEFCVGTTASVEPFDAETNPTGYKDDDEFLHFIPSITGSPIKGLFLKLANFIVTAFSSTIIGTFIVRSKLTGKQLLKVSEEENKIYGLQKEKNYKPDPWTEKSWAGLTDFYGIRVWTDGENIYYSVFTTQYVFNKATSSWEPKSWTGLTVFYGEYIWTDGESIYYSDGTNQYVLNKATSTWETKTWTGLTVFYGEYIWTDGENIYYSYSTTQYVLNKATSTWTEKSWSGLNDFYGNRVWTDGENIYCSYETTHRVLNKATSTWEEKTWTGLTDFSGLYVWTDGENIYYSVGATQYVLNKATSTWTEKSWAGLTSFYGNRIWTDGDNIYYSSGTNQYMYHAPGIERIYQKEIGSGFVSREVAVDGSRTLTTVDGESLMFDADGRLVLPSKSNVRVSLRHGDTWFSKTWTGLTNFSGLYVWTDGENIYYSYGATQYVLNKSTSTWSVKTWTGLTNFYSNYVWTDGENIYYSYGGTQCVLNKATSTWTEKSWAGLTEFDGYRVWTDGENIYYSDTTTQYVLNKATSTWTTKTWAGLTNFYGYQVWTDGENIYYSNVTNQYVLNKATSTWTAKTWSGLTNFYGYRIWTDGENIYHSEATTHRVLNKETSTWSEKTWSGLTNCYGNYNWTDGENIYYSDTTTQYELPATRHNYIGDNKYNSLFGTVTGCRCTTLTAMFVFGNE